MVARIHVVINPGISKPRPIRHSVNAVFRLRDIKWDISLIRKSGDMASSTRTLLQARF
jgi:hypothetical protein